MVSMTFQVKYFLNRVPFFFFVNGDLVRAIPPGSNSFAALLYVLWPATSAVDHALPTMGGEAHMPFGGVKATGIGGREMNEEALEFFTEIKTIYFDYTGGGRTSNVY